MSDSTHTILRSASRFFSGTMLSRISGMLRDIAMAYAFGTQSAVAALLVAFRLAHLLRRLLGEGAMQTALIPHFEELRRNSPQRAGIFFRDLAFSITHLLIVLIVVIMGLLAGLYYSGILSEGNAEIVWLTFLMMPSLLFICLYGINAALLQCEKSYFIPSVSPVLFNIVWIIGVFCTWFFPLPTAMSFLSLFISLACLAQWIATAPSVHAILKSQCGMRPWKNFKLYSADVKSLTKPLVLGIIGLAASQINNAVDAVFARWADPEGPAILWYAIRLQQLPLALFGIAISGALLPPLSRAYKAADYVKFNQFINYAIRKSLLLMIPMTAGLFLLGHYCITLIFGHGNFSSESILKTTHALWGYTCGLIPMAMILVVAPIFYAKGDYRTPSLASTYSMGLNIILNSAMVAIFDLGATSIALATSISAWFNLAYLGIALQRRNALCESPRTQRGQ